MKVLYGAIFLVGVALVSVGQAFSPTPAVPARLQSPSTEARRQLREVTANFLGLSSVALAEDTLTKESQFVMSRTPHSDATGQLLQGRVIETGHIFRLILRGNECWLIYQNKEQLAKLSLAICVAE